MKLQISFIIAFFCITISAKERVVERPAFDAWSTTTLEIQRIVVNDTATIVDFDAFYYPGSWIQVSKGSYLEADGKQYKLLSANGIELDKMILIPESGTFSFQMIFPTLPEHTTSVDFTEGNFDNAFSIWGIHLDGTPLSSPLAGKKNGKETEVLAMPELKSGIATLKGHIAGFRPGIDSGLFALISNSITDRSDKYKIKADKNGNFQLAIPLNHISDVSLSFASVDALFFMQPGETTCIEINLPEICRAQSRFHKDQPSLGEEYYFSGVFAALNNDINNCPLQRLPVLIRSQEAYEQMEKDVATMNPDQCKQYWLNRLEKSTKELDKYPEISDAYRQYLLLDANIETFQHLISISKPGMTTDYYDFIPKLIPYSPFILYSSRYTDIIRSLQRINLSGKPEPESFLFDLITARKIVRPILDFRPLTNDQLAEADELSPAIRNMLICLNDKLKQTIEENKKNSGYTKDNTKIVDIPAEELFDKLTTPYRGKVVLIDFWATWCSPCRTAMHLIKPVKEEYEGKNVVFLYLVAEDSPIEDWNKMIPDIKGEHYRVTREQWNYWKGKFGIDSVPSYMILAKDGTQTHFQVGFTDFDEIRKMIGNELAK